jgi:predicted metal-dependent hydrolase
MIDWLRRNPKTPPQVEVAGHCLPLVVRRLGHARRLTLRLAPDGSEVRVSMPRWGRTEDALAFARSRCNWLAGQLASLPVPAEPLSHGATVPYRGAMLHIEHAEKAPRRPKLQEERIHLGGPAQTLQPRLRRWLEAEARRLLAEDLAHYCARAGVSVPKLYLSNAQRRWGSCSSRGAIRINWRLVMTPDEVRRSVVAHEVAHMIHFDHSPRFHALLGELFEGDIAEANRWLKRQGRSLYRHFG